ncbi:MAG: hypothetical protein H6666_00595 [Ardenticatenaceae bacterium]|nr:hypothetical protein [Ardenticatenaceae bacterium]
MLKFGIGGVKLVFRETWLFGVEILFRYGASPFPIRPQIHLADPAGPVQIAGA